MAGGLGEPRRRCCFQQHVKPPLLPICPKRVSQRSGGMALTAGQFASKVLPHLPPYQQARASPLPAFAKDNGKEFIFLSIPTNFITGRGPKETHHETGTTHPFCGQPAGRDRRGTL